MGLPAKILAGLFILWGILHLRVGFEGAHQYFASPAAGQWKMLIGGSLVPTSSFAYPTDAATIHAQSNLIVNFCLDVAGYGVLGIWIAWSLFTRASWLAYFLGVIVIGIVDVGYFLLFVWSGVISLDIDTVLGPVVWAIAVVIIPFGMPLERDRGGSTSPRRIVPTARRRSRSDGVP